MHNKCLAIFITLLLTLSMFVSNFALAETSTSTVVINEVMTASLSSNKDEFIELYNLSNSDQDISGWSLDYVTGSNITTKIHTFSSGTFIAKDGRLLGVLSQTPASLFLNDISPKFEYNLSGAYGLALSAGRLVLKDRSEQAIDSVGWVDNQTASDNTIATGMSKGKSVERVIVDGVVKNSGFAQLDFAVNDIPTPSAINDVSIDIIPEPTPTPEPTPNPDNSSGTSSSQDQNNTNEPNDDNNQVGSSTDSPIDNTETGTTNNSGSSNNEQSDINSTKAILLPIAINELLIDPLAPLTDTDDEFVELFNVNDSDINLAGYAIVAGTTGSYKHVFSSSQTIPAKGYVVITSKDTSIALSNSGGKVTLIDPQGIEVDSVIYDQANIGESWAKNDSGQWQWTTTVTPAAVNIFTIALPLPAKQATVTANTVKKASVTATPKPKTTTVTTPKAASTKATKATAVKAATDTNEYIKVVDAPVFIPVWLLALMGTLALLYLGYEYRYEISNKFYQLKQYRANR